MLSALIPIAKNCCELFEGLGTSLYEVYDNKDELQSLLADFLFSDGPQYFGLRTTPMKLRHSKEISSLGSGDISVDAEFISEDKYLDGKGDVNILHGTFMFGGMLGLEVLSNVARELIEQISKPSSTGVELEVELKRVFSASYEELGKFVNFGESRVDISRSGNVASIALSVLMDLEDLGRHYESVEHLLGHLKYFGFTILDGSGFPLKNESTESSILKAVEDAHVMMLVSLINRGKKDCELKIEFCLEENSRHMVYMNAKQTPIMFDFAQNEKFVCRCSITIKILELGCATLTLPESLILLENVPSLESVEKMRAEILYVGRHGRITGLLMRPFLNISLFKLLIVQGFLVEFKVEREIPLEKVGRFCCEYNVVILKPRHIVIKCFTVFVRRQISSLDFLLLMSNIFCSLGADFKGITPLEV